ncbi:hypothetical protein GCM10027040_26310 [Halomonas shantousis]
MGQWMTITYSGNGDRLNTDLTEMVGTPFNNGTASSNTNFDEKRTDT